MRWRRLMAWAIASVVLGCTPAPPSPAPSPSFTPPPAPADVIPWPDIVWSLVDGLTVGDPGFGEGAVAVAFGPQGFVTVGYRDGGETRDGLIWYSADGQTWSAVDAPAVLAGIELVDVTATSFGFLALGLRSAGGPDDRTDTVFLRSTDGHEWVPVPEVPRVEDTYPTAVTAGSAGVVAVGSDGEGKTTVWRSDDGNVYERLVVQSEMSDAVSDPHAVERGFIALGSGNLPPVLLRSTDGRDWTETSIDASADVVASRLVPGRWGYVVQGVQTVGCVGDEPCDDRSIGWWSGDGTRWARLPEKDTPIGDGASIVVPAGDHGLVALDGAGAWESPDGWAWRPLPEPGDGSMAVADAVVAGDVIVAVGTVFGEDGIGRTAIDVARPPAD
ncbi:MAG TPA: hypothetical protein VIB02_00450 [Candidatus Limnocylindrales bacterium]|jgi:hypothetical protein